MVQSCYRLQDRKGGDPAECPADIQGTGDGIVGAEDLATLLGNWGPCE